ncbi:MAG: hypothetical protein M3P38_08005 [Chloroflexota bacterium]|nr:hypothetical protein [Chloroflexota bacterium]
MDTNEALDAIVTLRSIWARKQGRVTLADLDLVLRRCVRSRGHAALPPERWRGHPWVSSTRHEWVSLEAA